MRHLLGERPLRKRGRKEPEEGTCEGDREERCSKKILRLQRQFEMVQPGQGRGLEERGPSEGPTSPKSRPALGSSLHSVVG